MNCKKIKRFLTPYLDKELKKPDIITEIEKHLETCLSCQNDLKTLKSIKNLVHKKEKIKADKMLLPSIIDKVNEDEEIKIEKREKLLRLFRNELIPSIATAAAVILVVISINLLKMDSISSVDELILSEMSVNEVNELFRNIELEKLLSGD